MRNIGRWERGRGRGIRQRPKKAPNYEMSISIRRERRWRRGEGWGKTYFSTKAAAGFRKSAEIF
jgi:hypothetical protein